MSLQLHTQEGREIDSKKKKKKVIAAGNLIFFLFFIIKLLLQSDKTGNSVFPTNQKAHF